MQSQHSTCISIRYDHVLAAWREQVTTAVNSPDIKHQILYQERELLPRFAAQYTKLSALPRRARRAMQRQWKRSLAGVALLLALGQASTLMAATINVGGGCTLIEAIDSANSDTAIGGCAAGSGGDTIVLPQSSTQTLRTVNDSTFGPTGLPDIASVITIQGNGATIRRDSTAPQFRVFRVRDGARLSLQQTTVSGGIGLSGGGVYNAGGAVSLTGSKITGNVAYAGGGGGVTNFGTLTVTNSIISSNSLTGGGYDTGGGIQNSGFSSRLTITRSTIAGNSAEGFGGGVYNGGGASFAINNGTISGNTGDGGGGVANFDANVAVTNSTVAGNSSDFDGGGLLNESLGTLTLRNSTVTGNSASRRGGGVSNNYGGKLTLTKTLVAGNAAPNGREINHGVGTVTANNFNVFGFNGNAGIAGFKKGATDIVPRVGLSKVLNTTLANNGGRTRTHALPAGSPAIDTVSDGTCPPPARDQRGVRRPRDGDGGTACDTGSFER